MEYSPQRVFYVNNRQFKSNSNRIEKYSEDTEMSKSVIKPEDFNELEKQLTGSILQNGCSENWIKFPGKHPR